MSSSGQREPFQEEPLAQSGTAITDLRVSEIFESIQGEGVNVGTPSTFLRLALCNLRCAWCDTKYTWDWSNYDYDEEVHVMPAGEVIELLRARSSTNIVITGGEPLLQQRQLVPVLNALKSERTFEVETAGTLAPAEELASLIHIWNVSPKLANSGNALSARRRAPVLSSFAQMENAYFKFVLESESDIEEVLALVRECHIPSRRVFLMPQATDAEAIQERSRWLAPLCLRYQFRLSYRLHVALWGNKRGV